MTNALQVLDRVVSEVDAGRRVALCVIVATRGSTPQSAGAFACVNEAAQMTGTLGGGCVEAELRRRAHGLLSVSPHGRRHPPTVSPKRGDERGGALRPAARSVGQGELISFALDDDFGLDEGMICGGRMDVAVTVLSPSADIDLYRKALERLREGVGVTLPVRVDAAGATPLQSPLEGGTRGDLPPPLEGRTRGGAGYVEYRVHIEAAPELVIAGAGHIGRILAQMLVPLGFHVNVVDDRADYANADRFGPPIETTVDDIASTLKSWPVGANTYIVIVTRGHKHDEEALKAVLDSPARYIGMIGSRRKIEVIFDDLRHEGATEAQLSRVHAPIGLDINAVTTEEIALSIAAQLVAERRSDYQDVVDGPFPVWDDTT